MTGQTNRPPTAYRILRDWFAAFAAAFVAAIAARLVMGGAMSQIGGVMAFSALLATVLIGIRLFQHRYRH